MPITGLAQTSLTPGAAPGFGSVPSQLGSGWDFSVRPNLTNTYWELTGGFVAQPGTNTTISVTGASALAGSATELPGQTLTTTTAANATAQVLAQGDGSQRMESVGHIRFRAKLNQITNCRCWLGLTNRLGNSSLLIDQPDQDGVLNPGINIIGFRFSATTDTTWKAYASSSTINPGTHTIIDTGITADTNMHTFDIIITPGGSAKFYIDGVLVASMATSTGGVQPAASVSPCWLTMYIDNKSSGTAPSLSWTICRGTVPAALK